MGKFAVDVQYIDLSTGILQYVWKMIEKFIEIKWKLVKQILVIVNILVFHVKHVCKIMIYGDVIWNLIMNELVINDNKMILII